MESRGEDGGVRRIVCFGELKGDTDLDNLLLLIGDLENLGFSGLGIESSIREGLSSSSPPSATATSTSSPNCR